MRRRDASARMVVMLLALCAASCDGDDGSKSGTGGSAADGGASGGTGGTGGSAATGGVGGTSGGSGSAGAAGSAGTSGTPSPLGVGGNWTLVWSDEFDGTSLDLAKWRPNWFGSTDTAITEPVNALEASCYDPAQVKVSGGLLELTAIATTQAGCVKKDGSPASFASGLVMSDGRYNFSYGFVEARMWLAPGTGTPWNWAAFWLNGQTWPEDGEIDIMETLGGGTATRWTYHYDSDTGSGTTHSQLTASPNNLISASGWHVFGASWQTDVITFYYDGENVGSVASADLEGGATIPGSPHYIILNYGLELNEPIQVPATLKVDYVRHWQ